LRSRWVIKNEVAQVRDVGADVGATPRPFTRPELAETLNLSVRWMYRRTRGVELPRKRSSLIVPSTREQVWRRKDEAVKPGLIG